MTEPKSSNGFVPLMLDKEIDLIRNDDAQHTALHDYLSPLVEAFVEKIEPDPDEESAIRAKITADLPKALQLYSDNDHPKKGIKFSTYFMWWMYEGAKQIKPNIEKKFD